MRHMRYIIIQYEPRILSATGQPRLFSSLYQFATKSRKSFMKRDYSRRGGPLAGRSHTRAPVEHVDCPVLFFPSSARFFSPRTRELAAFFRAPNLLSFLRSCFAEEPNPTPSTLGNHCWFARLYPRPLKIGDFSFENKTSSSSQVGVGEDISGSFIGARIN